MKPQQPTQKVASKTMKKLSFLIVGAVVALSPVDANAASNCSKLFGVSFCHDRSKAVERTRSDSNDAHRKALEIKAPETNETHVSVPTDSAGDSEDSKPVSVAPQSKLSKKAEKAAKRAEKARARAERLAKQSSKLDTRAKKLADRAAKSEAKAEKLAKKAEDKGTKKAIERAQKAAKNAAKIADKADKVAANAEKKTSKAEAAAAKADKAEKRADNLSAKVEESRISEGGSDASSAGVPAKTQEDQQTDNATEINADGDDARNTPETVESDQTSGALQNGEVAGDGSDLDRD